jgi:hypothetical protein
MKLAKMFLMALMNFFCAIFLLFYSFKSLAYAPLCLTLAFIVFFPTLYFIIKKYEKFQRFVFYANLIPLLIIIFVSLYIFLKHDVFRAWGSLVWCVPFLLNLIFIVNKSTPSVASKKLISEEESGAVTNVLDKKLVARYPLGKLFFAFTFLLPTIWYAINFIVYPPLAPSGYGIAMVLTGYYGHATGLSIWLFAPVLVYRVYIRIRGKQYSKRTELRLLILGGIVTLLGFIGDMNRPSF